MKYSGIFFLVLITSIKANSQSLAGIWEGWYLSPTYTHDTIIMKLDIRLKDDGMYEIHDFTEDKDFKAVCRMTYKLLAKNLIYLEEVEVIRVGTSIRTPIMQNMKLYIDKDYKTMSGTWHFNAKEFRSTGEIYFRKKR